MDPPLPRPSPWPALLLALLCPGLGHAHAGRVRAGFVAFCAWLGAIAGLAFGMRSGPAPMLAALAAMTVLWLGQAVHAGLAARRPRAEPALWLSQGGGLVLLYAAATAASIGVAVTLRHQVAHTFVTSSNGMIPTLESGDLFVVSPGAPIERGAVVVHAAPRGSRHPDPLLKRVVAVAGDVVEVRDGRLLLNGAPVPGEEVGGACTYWARELPSEWVERPCRARTETLGTVTYRIYCTPDQPCGDVAPERVPPGHVFVLGDHRDHSADSRVYGPIPEASILGRATWISFSFGPGGVRMERVGKRVE